MDALSSQSIILKIIISQERKRAIKIIKDDILLLLANAKYDKTDVLSPQEVGHDVGIDHAIKIIKTTEK